MSEVNKDGKKAPQQDDQQLDQEELEMLAALEAGQFEEVTDPASLEEIRAAAKATVEDRKSIAISIRLPADDLEMLKARASIEGLPYQTLVKSIIHRYSTGQLLDKNHFIDTAGVGSRSRTVVMTGTPVGPTFVRSAARGLFTDNEDEHFSGLIERLEDIVDKRYQGKVSIKTKSTPAQKRKSGSHR